MDENDSLIEVTVDLTDESQCDLLNGDINDLTNDEFADKNPESVNAYIFAEGKQIVLDTSLVVDWLNDVDDTGVVYGGANQPVGGSIAAGVSVTSHLLHLDTVGMLPATVSGTATFDDEILGVILDTGKLNLADSIVGVDGVKYPSASGRAWEIGGKTGTFSVSEDGKTITVVGLVEQLLDQLRIITRSEQPIKLEFDELPNLSTVTDQFRKAGVLFDSGTVIAQGTSGVDGSASFPNTVIVTNTGNSLFDGKNASEITACYDISQQQGFGESFADISFVIAGTATPAETNFVSILVGFDFVAVGANEVNRVVLEAFDSNFDLIEFDLSPQLVSAIPTELTVFAEGIRGVRITQSDGVTFDNFCFNATTVASFVLGDINCDGDVNLLDVAPFVDALTGMYNAKADINEDGVVDLLDVAPFVDLFTSG